VKDLSEISIGWNVLWEKVCLSIAETGGSKADRVRGVWCGIRMFINESRGIVDLVVDDNVKILFRRVIGYFSVGDLFCAGHLDCTRGLSDVLICRVRPV